jgi:3-(3-hydroxy-phenyl)propionate hydroxylase
VTSPPADPPPVAAPDLEADVAVVGYGPVGALAALLLGQAGLTCVVVDRRVGVHQLPRAVAADDEVLRILAAAGLEETVAGMVAVPGAVFLGRDGREVLRVDFDGAPNGQPGLALFRQPELEAALRAGVARLPGVRTVLGRAVVGLRQAAGAVTLALDDGTLLRAPFVVGADGANSTVRDLVGVGVRGPRKAQRWLVVDVRTDEDPPAPARVTYSCDPRLSLVHMPVPGGRRLELLLALGAAEPDVDALLAAHLDGVRGELERVATYEYRVRRARRWRAGRVLLAGDAAHTMPPFAGQGLAAGLRDVVDLGWRLPLVVRGVAGPRLLDDYERERRPHVARMTRLSRVAGAVLTTRSEGGAGARDRLLRTATRVPAVREWFASGGPRPRQALRSRGPAAALRPSGRPLGLLPYVGPDLDRLLAHGPALVSAGARPRLAAYERGLWEAVGGSVLVVADLEPTLGPDRVALVRPDRHVVALVAPARAGRALERFARRLGGQVLSASIQAR